MNPDTIPVIGITVLNRADLLTRLVKSFDYPVEKLVIVNNGTDVGVSEAIANMKFPMRVSNHPENIGWSASCNEIIRECPAPYHVILNSDVAFLPGQLHWLDQQSCAHLDKPAIVMGIEGMSAFSINERCVEAIGTFDENFWPCWFSDWDYNRRVFLGGATLVEALDFKPIHDKNSSTDYSRLSEKECARHYYLSRAYYYRKWGAISSYVHPFNNPAWPISKWVLDTEERRKHYDIRRVSV